MFLVTTAQVCIAHSLFKSDKMPQDPVHDAKGCNLQITARRFDKVDRDRLLCHTCQRDGRNDPHHRSIYYICSRMPRECRSVPAIRVTAQALRSKSPRFPLMGKMGQRIQVLITECMDSSHPECMLTSGLARDRVKNRHAYGNLFAHSDAMETLLIRSGPVVEPPTVFALEGAQISF